MKKTYIFGIFLIFLGSFIQYAHADSLSSGCSANDTYSPTTGQLCVISQTCQPGDLYNSQTGSPCSGNTYLPGCFAGSIYSVTTGEKCDGSIPVQNVQPIASNATLVAPIQTMNTSDTTALMAAKSNAESIIATYTSNAYRDYRIVQAYQALEAAYANATADSASDQPTVDSQTTALTVAMTTYNNSIQEATQSTVKVTGDSSYGTVLITYSDGTKIPYASSTTFDGAEQIAQRYWTENNIVAPLEIVTQ